VLISAKIDNPVFISKLENNWRKLYGLQVNQGNLKILRELQNKNQKLEDKIAQMEAENNRDFSCLTVNLGHGNNNFGQQIIGNNNIHVNNILQTAGGLGQYSMPGVLPGVFNSNAQLSRMRADSQTSTYSDSLNINNLNHPIKSHETTNSASFNSETMTMNTTNNNQNQANNFSNNLLAEFNKMKAENNRLRERNEDLEENSSKLRNHLFSMKNQGASGKNNNSSGSKSDSDKSRKIMTGYNSIGNETLTHGEQNNRESTNNIEFGQISNRNSSEMAETTINDDTNTNAGETTTTLELDELVESDELFKKRQEIYEVNVKLDEERKNRKHWQEKYKEKSKAYSDIKNRYGRADRQWMEEKRRRTDIENHHEQVYACTRNKLKIVNDAKSCLEAENRSMKRLIDGLIVNINQQLTEKLN